MTRMIGSVLCAISILSLNTDCASRLETGEPTVHDTKEAPLQSGREHAIYDARLKQIMMELQKESIEHWPEEMDDEHRTPPSKGSAFAFEQAEPLGQALAKAAKDIPISVAHMKMLPSDRRAFAEHAAELNRKAQSLSAAARGRDRVQMKQALQAIDATCRSCHDRFLDVSGPLSRL